MSVLSQSESSQHGPRQPYSAMMVQDMAPPASMQPGVAVVPSTQCNSSAVQQRNSLDGYDGTDAEVDDHMRETDDMREGEDKTDDEGDDSDTNTKRGGNKVRKPHLQGRFSGRLETKADEKRLADECKLLGHLLGGVGKRGEKSRLTLAKIVRGIASGDVRKHCEAREQLLQNQQQQLKSWEQNSPSHMQMVQQQQPFSLQGDPDTKMLQITGFDHDRQQLATAMAGSMTLASNSLANNALTGVGSPRIVQVPNVSAVHALSLPPPTLSGSAATAVVAAVAQQELRQQQQQSQQAIQPGALVVHSNGGEPQAMQMVASPKIATSQAQSTSSMTPQAAQEAHALANASETLKAQAQTLKAHAENLHAQSYQAVSQPAHMQVAAKAQSLATHAQSLEAQAEAQNLQAQAHVHAHAHAEAQAQAQHLAAQAQAHAQAQAQANAHATHLKSAASFGAPEAQEAQQVAVHAHNLEAQAHAHAEAQVQAAVQAHSLAAKAQAHAHAQAQAQAQAQNMAFQAHNLQAHAQQLEVESGHGVTNHINVGLQHQVDQVPNPCGLVAAQQAGAVSQLVPLPTAQQLPTAAPPVPQLSVQTSLKLQTSSLQPDISAQLHAVSHTATALPDTSARGMMATALNRGSPTNHLLFSHPASSGLQTPANPSTVFLLTSSAPESVTFSQGVQSPTFLTQMPLQGQTTLLQQQPNGLLIQSQALASQTGSQPSALHCQLSSQQIGSLQQQVQDSLQHNQAVQQQQLNQAVQQQQHNQAIQQQQHNQAVQQQQSILQCLPNRLEQQLNVPSADMQALVDHQHMQGGQAPAGNVVHVQMMQPDSLSQLSAHNTNSIANALGLTSGLGLNHTDCSHGPTGSNV